MTEADFRNLKERVRILEAAVHRLAQRARAPAGGHPERVLAATENPFYLESAVERMVE
jgi:hypothetical protein